ncbi:MAG: hypothetical protein QM811_14465 [Pirellulales bacterium]
MRITVGLGSTAGVAVMERLLAAAQSDEATRLTAAAALLAAKRSAPLDYAAKLVSGDRKASPAHLAAVLAALDRSDDPRVAEILIAAYPTQAPPARAKSLESLTQCAAWSKALLAAIQAKTIAAGDLNANQIARFYDGKDPAINELAKAIWGTIRAERNPRRELVIDRMRNLIRKGPPGDPIAGEVAFQRVCAMSQTARRRPRRRSGHHLERTQLVRTVAQ